MTKGFKFLRGLKMAFFMVVFLLAGGFLVMFLWNWLMPVIFGAKLITFIQALGLMALGRLLFGGFGKRGFGGGGGHFRMRERMMEKWAAMSPEEREQMRGQWMQHGCKGRRFGKEEAAAKTEAGQ